MRGRRTVALDLWAYIASKEDGAVDARNGLGPFIEPGNVIHRHMRCGNYDACLSFAASNSWPSFGCVGCRKTNGGVFLDPPPNTSKMR